MIDIKRCVDWQHWQDTGRMLSANRSAAEKNHFIGAAVVGAPIYA